MRHSIVEVATLEDGETERVAFEGETMPLTKVCEKAGFADELANATKVLRNEVEIPADKLEEATVRNGDVVFLIPLIEGGNN